LDADGRDPGNDDAMARITRGKWAPGRPDGNQVRDLANRRS
jgi:hypothetical protein